MNIIATKQVETQAELDARIEQQGYVAYWAKIVPPCPYDKGTNGWTQWQKGLQRAAEYDAEQLKEAQEHFQRMEILRAEIENRRKADLIKRTEKQHRNAQNRKARAEANRQAQRAKSNGKGK